MARRRLVLAAKCDGPTERAWLEAAIRPDLGAGVEWVGEADEVTTKGLLAHARCLLAPIRWEEPFGLVMVEATACGTPVVALRRWGGAPGGGGRGDGQRLRRPVTCPGRSIGPGS